MGKHSRLTFQDLYYDGKIDERYEVFCEDSQQVMSRKAYDGWDEIHTVKNGRGYIHSSDMFYDKEYGVESDDWYIKMLNGEIKRIDDKQS